MSVGFDQFPADAGAADARAGDARAVDARVGAEILPLPAANGGAGAAVAILRRREPTCRVATQERESRGAGGERSEGTFRVGVGGTLRPAEDAA